MAKQIVGVLVLVAQAGMAQVNEHSHDHAAHATGWDFSPHASTALAVGGSTGDDDFLAESGHHDPHYDGFNMQAMEVGGRLSYGEEFSLMAIYNLQWDREESWDGHWEEAYMDFRMLPSFSIRTGMQSVHFGRENHLHVHARDFVEASLATTRFMGEDGLIVYGASFTHTWGDDEQHSLTWGGGSVFSHEHEHDEEEHDDYPLHAEEGLLQGNVLQARWQSRFGANSFGLSGLVGENHWNRTTFIVGADAAHQFTIAGKSASLAAEWSYRHVDGIREDNDEKTSFDETALAITLAYEFAEDWQSNSRLEWLSGADIAGLDERTRFSTNVSRFDCWFQHWHGTTRLQYDADFLPGGEVESTVWLQLVLEWGDH